MFTLAHLKNMKNNAYSAGYLVLLNAWNLSICFKFQFWWQDLIEQHVSWNEEIGEWQLVSVISIFCKEES